MPIPNNKTFLTTLIFSVFLLLFSADLAAAALERGPYLQQLAPDQVVVRWRTRDKSDSVVFFGSAVDGQNRVVSDDSQRIDHELKIDGLEPGTRYFYSIGDSASIIAGGSGYYFTTAPRTGSSVRTRVWVLGDPGSQSGAGSRAVRDAYASWSEGHPADMILMLGDNAYTAGLDRQYQVSVFDRFKLFLRNTALWSVIGNHEGNKGTKRKDSSDSVYQTGPYYDIFSFPKKGESGGVASNTEAYYSFDFGEIHFVMLDSYFSTDNRQQFKERMVAWLKSDLSNQNAKWIIAAWHHSPYSKGSHDSDSGSRETYIRESILPILEDHGVDLVLTGHSHAYERSYFLHGLYGKSVEATRNPQVFLDHGNGRVEGVLLSDGMPATGAYRKSENGKGTVYVVSGNASSVSSRGSLDHPAMAVSYRELGSVVIDIEGDRLTSVFLDDKGLVRDRFTISKGQGTPENGDEEGASSGGGSGTDNPQNPLPEPAGEQGMIEKRISESSNDAEESTTGSINLVSTDLEMTRENKTQIIGLRFNKLKLPAGSKVKSAWIQFEVDEVNTRETALYIHGELTGYSKKLVNRRFDLTTRATTRHQVSWVPAPWRKRNAHGADQRTPDLAVIIQEILDGGGWKAGNAMTFIISGTGKRVAESFDGEPAAAPLLHVEYE